MYSEIVLAIPGYSAVYTQALFDSCSAKPYTKSVCRDGLKKERKIGYSQ